MSVNPSWHKVVVVLDGTAFGYSTLSTAVLFIEEIKQGQPYAKIVDAIATALGEDKSEDLQIWSIDEYVDLFMDEDEDVNDENI